MTDAIVIDDYSFRYHQTKRRALRTISLRIPQGSFLSIVGPNGAGKTTLCNAIVGLIPHYFFGQSAGSITVAGLNTLTTPISVLSQHVGLVFQNPFNQISYTADTVAEELAFGLANRGVPRGEIQQRVDHVAELMHLQDLLKRNPTELSGGQVQRVAFGSAYITEPEILVLDECTTQLDPLGSEEIFSIIKELSSNGTTVISADHDLERVARYSDQVLVLDRGRMVAHGSPSTLFSSSDADELPCGVPVYTRISRQLLDEGLAQGNVTTTEEETVALVKEATCH